MGSTFLLSRAPNPRSLVNVRGWKAEPLRGNTKHPFYPGAWSGSQSTFIQSSDPDSRCLPVTKVRRTEDRPLPLVEVAQPGRGPRVWDLTAAQMPLSARAGMYVTCADTSLPRPHTSWKERSTNPTWWPGVNTSALLLPAGWHMSPRMSAHRERRGSPQAPHHTEPPFANSPVGILKTANDFVNTSQKNKQC